MMDEVVVMCLGLEFMSDVIEVERNGEVCVGGMFVLNGVVVDASRYLIAFWDACGIFVLCGVVGMCVMLCIVEVDDVKVLLDEFD